MDFQDLTIFARTSALRNLTAVAAELGISAGTISKRILALEDELAVRLFERTTRSVRMTEEGNRFLVHAERILSELDLARSSIAASAGTAIGKLKVSAPQIFGSLDVGLAVVGFLQAFPEIEVQIDLTDRIINLREDGYDIVMQCGALDDSTLIAKRLARDKIVVAASPDYLARYGTPNRPEDISAHQSLALGQAWSWEFANGAQTVAIRLTPRLRSDNTAALRTAALAGLGLLRTTEITISDDLVSGRLIAVLADHIENSSTGIFALYQNSHRGVLRQRLFLDHMAQWFKARRS